MKKYFNDKCYMTFKFQRMREQQSTGQSVNIVNPGSQSMSNHLHVQKTRKMEGENASGHVEGGASARPKGKPTQKHTLPC